MAIKLASPKSIRLREGDWELIARATGRPPGEVIRDTMMAYVERLKLEQEQANGTGKDQGGQGDVQAHA